MVATRYHHRMQLRLATLSDAEAIRTIYNAEVTGSTATFDLVPRNAEEQLVWLTEHGGAYPAIVAEDDAGVIVGFGSISIYRDRPAYATSVENSVYFDPKAQGRGAGKLIMQELIARCEQRGFRQMVAVIGDSANAASIGVHRSTGFKMIGTCESVGFKFGRWLDTVMMQRDLGEGATTLPNG